MQHKDMRLCACGFDPVDQLLRAVDFLAIFHCEKTQWDGGRRCLALTHQAFPVFQSSPVTPASDLGGRIQIQSVSMLTVVSAKTWLKLKYILTIIIFLTLMEYFGKAYRLGLSQGMQTESLQWLGGLVLLIETSQHVRKKGQKARRQVFIMRHGLDGELERVVTCWFVAPLSKWYPLNWVFNYNPVSNCPLLMWWDMAADKWTCFFLSDIWKLYPHFHILLNP